MRAWEVDWGLALAIAQCIGLALIVAILGVLLVRVRAAERIAAQAFALARRDAHTADLRARAVEAVLHDARRPWVVAEDLRLLRPDVWSEGRFDALAELVLRNTGASPARKVVVRLEPAAIKPYDGIDVLSRARVALFDARLLSGDSMTSLEAAVIVPGQNVARATRLSAPDVSLREVAVAGLSIVGQLEYEDAHGQRHTARFAFDLASRDGVWRFERRRDAGDAD